MAKCLKMVRHTMKILQLLLQDLQGVSEDFGTLYIKKLKCGIENQWVNLLN